MSLRFLPYILIFLFTSCKRQEADLITAPAEVVTATGADPGGYVTNGSKTEIKERGVCWSTTDNPSVSDSKSTAHAAETSFRVSMSDLKPATTYYYRAYAVSKKGTSYGNTLSLRTRAVATGTVQDVDGNIYNTVEIGGLTWMMENLKTSRYRNGDKIIYFSTHIEQSVFPGYYYYDNNQENNETYGKLYNWFAVSDPRNIAPEGWHVATDAEWTKLTDFIGGPSQIKKLVETGNSHWLRYLNATNETGFTALPGGGLILGDFYNIGYTARWWTSTEETPGYSGYAMHRSMTPDVVEKIYRIPYEKTSGMSVRCVKD